MSEDNALPEGATGAVIFQAPQPATVPRRASASAGEPVVTPAKSSTARKGSSAKGSQATKTAQAAKASKSGQGAKTSKSGTASQASESEKKAEDAPDAVSLDKAEAASSGESGDGAVTRRRRRGSRGRGGRSSGSGDGSKSEAEGGEEGSSSGTRRRRSRGSGQGRSGSGDDALAGSTRLQAKRQRRREGRETRRPILSEAEFLARRESVKRSMVVREKDGRVQIAVLEDDILVEHYVSHQADQSIAGNVYLARVQNVLPGMEAAFVDIGPGRNAVLYAGEVNWDAASLEGKPRRIELALKPGDTIMVQVTKDPIGHKGARVTSQISLAGRYLVYLPGGGVTGISRRLPDTERNRLKKLLREVIPSDAGVIVRTAAEGASEDELRADVERLKRQWTGIEESVTSGKAPQLLRGEPDMAIRVVRDIFNEDFDSLTIQGEDTWNSLSAYIGQVAPDLQERLHRFLGDKDVFQEARIDEQLAKGMARKVWLPSGGSLVIDRTEAMTVIDVNTGKFIGKGGTLEETMTLNNLEAAEEIVRQLRLRDIGGIIVIDFVDMLLEANRDRVLRRLIECLGRDRTKHQVAEVTTLGLVQMTRKRVGQGLVEAFSETCEHCKGRGFLVHGEPVSDGGEQPGEKGGRRSQKKSEDRHETHSLDERSESRESVKTTLASIAAAAEKAHHQGTPDPGGSSQASESDGGEADEAGEAPVV
ncbi:MAG: Rne/Rng family ribonuclease [Demequinaceae bacterium]|nr:Rne/Rng family ribonuclease [Demequinaceae bacterium]